MHTHIYNPLSSLVLLVCACVQDGPLGLGQPMQELISGGNGLPSQQPLITRSSSSRSGTLQNFPHWHANG